MPIRFANGTRAFFIPVLLLALMVAPALSRATLSICLVLFMLATTSVDKTTLQNFFKTPWLVGMLLLFLLPLVSGLWSENGREWRGLVRIKALLFFLPFAFASGWQLPQKWWRRIALFFVVVVAAGTIWSFENYWSHRAAISESYLRAKVFRTPLDNDHVRFSWLVSVAVLLCLWAVENGSRRIQVFAAFAGLWMAVYLHVLAARTGLFSLYLMLLFFAGWKLRHAKNKKLVIAVVLFAFLLPLAAWRWLPTFQNRIHYFVYDYSFIRSSAYLPGGNDGARMLSYRAGWHILKTHPFGVGAGDVFDQTNAWYKANVPNMVATDKLYPSSEWLLYGGSTGWPGVVLFTICMLLPFFYPPPAHRFYWYALCGTAALSFLFDIGLEVQYGVFLYAFLLLWWWKWFSLAPVKPTA